MAQLSLELLLGQFKVCILAENNTVSTYGESFISRTTCSFSSRYFGICGKAEFLICLAARMRNRDQSFLNKDLSRRLQIYDYIDFSQNVDWKMVSIISPKMRDLGFEIFFENAFSDLLRMTMQ